MLIQKIFAIQNINNTIDGAYLEKVITINQEYKIIVSQVLFGLLVTSLSVMEISCLPDSLLLTVLQNLEVKDVVSSSAVCSRWNEICKDQLLWKNLFENDYIRQKPHTAETKNSFVLAPNTDSWKSEYIRLFYMLWSQPKTYQWK